MGITYKKNYNYVGPPKKAKKSSKAMARPATAAQIRLMGKLGIDVPENCTCHRAIVLINFKLACQK